MIVCVQERHDDPQMDDVYFADLGKSLSIYSTIIGQATKNHNKEIIVTCCHYDKIIGGLRTTQPPCVVQDSVKLIVI